MTLPVMFTLCPLHYLSSVSSDPSAPCEAKKKRPMERRATLHTNQRTPPTSNLHLKKKRAVDRKVAQEARCRTEAAVTAQRPAAHASSPVVSALSSSSSSTPRLFIHPVLCPIIHASHICGARSTRHPSSTPDVITLCIKHLVSLCAKSRPLEQHRSGSAPRLTVQVAATSGINPLAHVASPSTCVDSYMLQCQNRQVFHRLGSVDHPARCFFLLLQRSPFITSELCFMSN